MNKQQDWSAGQRQGGQVIRWGHRTIPHAVSQAGSNSYGYDCKGNMTSRNIGGQNYTLTYDAENRLTAVSGAITATFVYDGDGNRVKGTVGAGKHP